MSKEGVACLVFLVFGLVVGGLFRTFLAWWRAIGEDEAREGQHGLAVKACSGCWASYTAPQWRELAAGEKPETGVDARICVCGQVLEIDAADLADERPFNGVRGEV
jgi:hypothetical protein